jgi:ribosomal protein S18 acetylase RimI-like enzyme
MTSSLAEPGLGMLAEDGLALVAIDETEPQNDYIVGTAMAAERHGRGYIWGMYVAPDKQGHGFGRLLLENCVYRLPQAKNFSVTVLNESPVAQAFYKALGFRYQASCKEKIALGIELGACIMTREARR